MEKITVKITGTAPLLMHSDRFSNPLDPMTKAHKELTGKRTKTEEDHLAIAYSEWCGGMYFDNELGPYIPGQMLDAVIINGGKLQKLGSKMKSGLMVVEDKIRLEYKGPRTMEKMYQDGRFVDCRSVKVQQARLSRFRPKFDEWSLTFTIAFNPDVIERRDIIKAITDAGMLVGLGDYRPRFGKFEVEVIPDVPKRS